MPNRWDDFCICICVCICICICTCICICEKCISCSPPYQLTAGACGPARLPARPVSSVRRQLPQRKELLSFFTFDEETKLIFSSRGAVSGWLSEVGAKVTVGWMWVVGWDDCARGGKDVRIFGGRSLHHPGIPCTPSSGITPKSPDFVWSLEFWTLDSTWILAAQFRKDAVEKPIWQKFWLSAAINVNFVLL